MTSENINELDLSADLRMALKANPAIIGSIGVQITLLETRLGEALKAEAATHGSRASLASVSRSPPSSPKTPGRYRVVPSQKPRLLRALRRNLVRHNGNKKSEGNRKNGNKYLSWAFVEAAQFALRYSEPAKRYYERKRAKTNVVVATKGLAHKLARASFHMLKVGKDFDATRCFA